MKRFIYSILLGLSFNFLGCGEAEKKVQESLESTNNHIQVSEQQFKNSGMLLGTLEEKSFPVTIRTTGMIDVPPENKVVISATIGGYIRKTPLLVGDRVKKGQALVTIENPEFVTLQQEYMEVKEKLSYLESEYQRQKTLVDENITSQKSFLKAESEYKTAIAHFNGLRQQLRMLNISPSQVEDGIITTTSVIYTPISGSITKVNVSKGTYVSPASPIMEIIDNDHIHLELSVFEKDIMKVKKGQLIQFMIPEASSDIYEADVYLIGASINENRTIKVHGHLKEESKNNFLTGMFVNAEIVTENTSAQALPENAIVEENGEYYVLRMTKTNDSGYAFEQIEVQTGNTSNGFTAIVNAGQFSSSDQFLTKGAFDLVGEEGGGHEH